MKTFRDSLSEVNDGHPLLGDPPAGMLAVSLAVLVGPSELTRAEAWGLFAAVGLGASAPLARRQGRRQNTAMARSRARPPSQNA